MQSLIDNYFKVIRKFIPSPSKATAVGIDIGSGDCKLVQLAKDAKGYELVHWAVEPIENGLVNNAIKKALEGLSEPPRNIYTAVAGKGTLVRYIDLPKMNIKDLKNSFSIEADKYFPFAQDQIYTDCYIVDDLSQAKQMSVLAVAVKKELVDQRIKLLNELGFQADFIGVNTIALANVIHVLGVDDHPADQPMAVLDMGDSVSNLTVMVKNLPRFSRDIYMGGRDLTKRISNALAISYQDAEKLKSQPGDQLDKVISACDATVTSLVQELRLSFDYFMTEKNLEIGCLYLTGGGSMLAGIAEAFEKRLEIKTVLWNPIKKFKLSDQISPEEANKIGLKLGVALGLALYNYDRN